jgi:hypothetical protein
VEADVLNIKVMQAQREQAEAAKNQANESGSQVGSNFPQFSEKKR